LEPAGKFLILGIVTDTNSVSNYHDMFDRLWNERGIMNVLTLIKSLKKLQAEYILAYDLFLVDATSNKRAMLVVQPDKLHELPKTYPDRKSNLHGYMLNVSMFHDRPTAVLQYDKLTGRLTSKGEMAKFWTASPSVRILRL